MKIAIIGGAGVRTVIFINGLIQQAESLNIGEVYLYDIDAEKLEIIAALCRHVVARAHAELQVKASCDLEAVVTGADYIVTTLRVGGDLARVKDERIALSQAVIGQETTGLGGFSMAVRTIPVLLDYCERFDAWAPQAWIFNFTNPSGLVTQALQTAGHERVVGICDAPSSTHSRMARYLGLTDAELYVEFYGLNHLSWIRSVKRDGRECLPELLADDAFLAGVQEFSMFDPDLLRMTGCLPNEYLYYYYHREKALANILAAPLTRGESIARYNREMLDELSAMDIAADPEAALQAFLYYMELREHSYMAIETGAARTVPLRETRREVPDGMGYAGVMLDCIRGLQSDEGRALVLSVKNKGALPCLADDDVIEITCQVDRGGIQPVKIDHLPPEQEQLIRQIKTYERLVVRGLREGSKELCLRALTLHPLISSFSLAKTLYAALEECYGPLLKKT